MIELDAERRLSTAMTVKVRELFDDILPVGSNGSGLACFIRASRYGH